MFKELTLSLIKKSFEGLKPTSSVGPFGVFFALVLK